MQRPADKLFVTTPFDEQVLFEVNRQAFHRTSSSALYQRHFGNRFASEDTLFVIVGTDSGLLPRWLTESGLAPGSRYLFVELPEVVDAVRGQCGQLFDDERLALGTADDWPELLKRYRLDEYLYLDRVTLVDSVGAADAHLLGYRSLSHDMADQLSAHRHNVRLRLGNQVFIRRQLDNVADNLWPAAHLKGCLDGRAAVVVAGGPSLDDLLPWIREHRDRFALIAVSRVCRQLLQADLPPDVVVSVDPQDISFDISKEMMRLPPETLFVHAYHASPLLVGQWHGPAAYCGNRFPWTSGANVDNLPAVGPTVTNAALALAVYLGCKTVVLAGVDLCFGRDGHTHASGSNERLAGPKLGVLDQRIMTNGGWLADTKSNLVLAAANLAQQAAAAARLGCRLVNPAQAAARIDNVEHLALEAIVLPMPDEAPLQTLRRALPQDTPAGRSAVLERTAKELARANGRLRQILHLIDDALECNARLHGGQNRSGDFKYKKRMDGIERKLDRQFAELTAVIKNFAAAAFLRLLRPGRSGDWSREELEDWGSRYYATYRAAAEKLLDHVEAAQQRVRSRLVELAVSPDIDLLADQWQADRTPGRARLQRARLAGDGPVDTSAHERLLALDAEFERILEDRDTAQARHCLATREMRMGNIRTKLLYLFDRQDTEELTRLARFLGDEPDDAAPDLRQLALAYLAELEGRPADALDHYQQVVDRAAAGMGDGSDAQENPRLEDALRRMSFLALQRGEAETAVGVLDVLAALSPAYEPQYADALRLAGRLQDAVQVYTGYLERVPGDLVTMLKLGRLFQDAGVAESARWAYDYVLAKDPRNSDARQLRDQLPG